MHNIGTLSKFALQKRRDVTDHGLTLGTDSAEWVGLNADWTVSSFLELLIIPFRPPPSPLSFPCASFNASCHILHRSAMPCPTSSPMS
ncbi:hypothetical protein JOB18_048380 [Solea senegalensis]|uniref:Uncharacterized protein n=1 Tax=Solea senegalensis TaxID=28829 RepID=A0AAV6SXG3_SOLSE|nr:hypothetical protein JOB18_048380 [Solea senegalensis]